MLRLIELEKSVVEGGGAVGVAAILEEGLLPELRVREGRMGVSQHPHMSP